MLAYAYQAIDYSGFTDSETEEFNSVKDLFAAILARGIAHQIKQGLAREYVQVHEDIPSLRGKICLQDTLFLRAERKPLLSCRYDNFSSNHLINQILKTTALLLLRDDEVTPDRKSDLKRSLLYFHEVAEIDPTNIGWRTINFHQNNASYRMLVNISYLVLKGLLLTTTVGEKRLARFDFDSRTFHALFERFLREYYKKHYQNLNPTARYIEWNVEEKSALLPTMQTDVLLTKGDYRLIIDAKFYSKALQQMYRSDRQTLRSSNMYQIFSYVKNEDRQRTGLVDGMLLYARTDEAIFPEEDYLMDGNRILVRTLNLDQNFEGIRNDLDFIVRDWLSNAYERNNCASDDFC
ncbi:MAG: 5-methylcytosine-specific restriction endonuclease system specificity protein McrC [Coriobacteriia bacterium]|nr:5-methylcytosine-specific restriction endonuclease system specificity protein McrC [Coriobacteriia bacterium]